MQNLFAAKISTKSRFGYMHTNNALNFLIVFKLKIFLIYKKLNMKYTENSDHYLLSYLSPRLSKQYTRI